MKTVMLLALVLVSGCAHRLAPGGAYNSDNTLYSADLAITTSYDVLHQFVTWEYQNRVALSAFPEVKQAADEVRKNAPGLINSAISLRDAYAALPTPEARASLMTILNLLKTAMFEATRHLANHQNL